MDVRFEDEAGFRRSAGLLTLGGAALSAFVPWTVPAAAAGAAFALAFAPGCGPEARRRRLLPSVGCAALLGQWVFSPAPWLLAAGGGLLGAVLLLARLDAARESGGRRPSGKVAALTLGLSAAAVLAAGALLPALVSVLAPAVPGWAASAACGASLGLWVGLCGAPLHLAVGADPIETRLAALRSSLGLELRGLAERAAAARRCACAELPEIARADLRAAIDSLALAALELAGRCAELGRAAAPGVEEELRRRSAALAQGAETAEDPAAKQSYQRAGEALAGQLEHFGRVRRARERALARLHEDVANLERARFSLTLLRGPGDAAELTLLEERLRHGAAAFEEAEALAAPVRAGA